MIFRICVDHFKYVGKKKILSDVKTYVPDLNKAKPMKARTLPARMSPPDFSKEPPTMPDKNNTVNRDNMASINKGIFLSWFGCKLYIVVSCS
jgi:dedicator of cytokinesis protein 9/10/11